MKTYLYPNSHATPIILQHIFRWLLLPLLLLTWSLTSFSQKANTSFGRKVVLNWNTPVAANYSHFVIERSLNNADYSEVGLLFTGDDAKTGENISYSFSDDVRNVRKGFLYYRINMVDMNGRVQRSVTHTVYTTESKPTPVVKVSPNPVVSDLRITLPMAWKDKFVSIELLNSNGQVVKYSLNQQTVLTETISVKDLADGIYALRVSNGNETVIQRIIKSK